VSSQQQISQHEEAAVPKSQCPKIRVHQFSRWLAWLISLQTRPDTASRAVQEEGFARLLPPGSLSQLKARIRLASNASQVLPNCKLHSPLSKSIPARSNQLISLPRPASPTVLPSLNQSSLRPAPPKPQGPKTRLRSTASKHHNPPYFLNLHYCSLHCHCAPRSCDLDLAASFTTRHHVAKTPPLHRH
jgi:hypothetical protein